MKVHTVKFKEWNCVLQSGNYNHPQGKPVALWLTGSPDRPYEGEDIATCTVNLVDRPIPKPGYVYIKAYSENEGMLEALVKANIIEPEFVIDTLQFGAPIALCKLKISLDD